MKFWDSSAVVPLLVEERASARFARIHAADPEIVVWWATEVECGSALARRSRSGDGGPGEALERARRQLDRFAQSWHEIMPGQEVRQVARRLLERHALRAGDALQLAAALAARGDQPEPLEFVCADERLSAAARSEGLTIADPDVVRERDTGTYIARRRSGAGRGRRQ